MSEQQKHGARRSRPRIHRVGNAWHQGFGQLMVDGAPGNFALRSEVEFYLKPCRVDLELRRKPGGRLDNEATAGQRRLSGDPRDHEARVLRGLWPRLGPVSLLEFKSPTRGFRRGELLLLWAYGCLYLAQHSKELCRFADLGLVLVVPAMNKALRDEIAFLPCELHSLEPGYASLVGLGYTTYVVVTNEVAEAERDEFLKIFSHHPVDDAGALEWLQDWLAIQEIQMPQIKRSKSFQEVRHKLFSSMSPEERLAGLSPGERLAGLSPQEVLAQFSPEERLAGLSPDQIRAYLESLSTRG